MRGQGSGRDERHPVSRDSPSVSGDIGAVSSEPARKKKDAAAGDELDAGEFEKAGREDPCGGGIWVMGSADYRYGAAVSGNRRAVYRLPAGGIYPCSRDLRRSAGDHC